MQVSGVHVVHTNDKYVMPQEVWSALLVSGKQLAVVLNYGENTDKMLSGDADQHEQINESWNKHSEELEYSCFCRLLLFVWQQCRLIVSERFLLGGDSAGEIGGRQVALLYIEATFELFSSASCSQWAIKHRSYYVNNDTTSCMKLIYVPLHTPLSNTSH